MHLGKQHAGLVVFYRDYDCKGRPQSFTIQRARGKPHV